MSKNKEWEGELGTGGRGGGGKECITSGRAA